MGNKRLKQWHEKAGDCKDAFIVINDGSFLIKLWWNEAVLAGCRYWSIDRPSEQNYKCDPIRRHVPLLCQLVEGGLTVEWDCASEAQNAFNEAKDEA